MLAYVISASAAAAAPASGTPASSRLAGPAGSARTTASASNCSGACAEPTVSRQPPGVRASPRTIALVRTTAPEAAATAGGSVPRPPVRVVKTGPGAGAAAPERRAGGAVGRRGKSTGRRSGTRRGVKHGAGGGCQRGVLPRGRGERGQRRLERQLLATGPRTRRRAADRPAGPRVPGRTSPPRSWRPTRHRPARSRAAWRRPGRWPARRAERIPELASSSRSAGTPMNCRRGSGRSRCRGSRSRPPSCRAAPAGRPGRPRRSGRVPSGRRASSASAPASTAIPADLGDRELAAEPWRSLQDGHRQARRHAGRTRQRARRCRRPR